MFVCDFYSYFLGIASEVMLKKIVSIILTNESDNPEEKRMCVCQKKYVLFSCCFCQKDRYFHYIMTMKHFSIGLILKIFGTVRLLIM